MSELINDSNTFEIQESEENLQLAENEIVAQDQKELVENEFFEKRNLLEKQKSLGKPGQFQKFIRKLKTKN